MAQHNTTSTNDIFLKLTEEKDHEQICKISRALSVPERIKILHLLLNQNMNLTSISQQLNLPVGSVARHIDTLVDAGLISVYYQPGLKGHTKYCSQALLNVQISLDKYDPNELFEPETTVEMPVGMFSHCHITAPCGMLGKEGPLGEFDDPRFFFNPERRNAECIWFQTGELSYNFPTTSLLHKKCTSLSFAFEVCSETTYFNNHWPSDITIFINKKEILTFTSPGDFGGRRGKLTPKYWPISSTQFGLLKRITVNEEGVFFDNSFITKDITIDALNLYEGNAIQFTLAIKEDAVHKGGINLFGKNFGDYPQAIIMTLK